LLRSLYKLVGKQIKKRISPIIHIETDKPLVALTFDDGPDPTYTPILLKIFRQFQAHATFFMVGEAALKYKWLLDEIAKDGHEIGNHTMDHISMMSVDRRGRRRQMQMCKEVLSPNKIRLFRPPYGEQNVWTNLDAVLQGYQVVGWDLNVGDWCNTEFSPMADELLKRITSGSVILFHDTIYDQGKPKHKALGQESNLNRSVMVDLVTLLLKECSSRFQFVTMTEMLKNGRAMRAEVLR
jgi:peptidoglycan-N-acetylglucosamine deacetylase